MLLRLSAVPERPQLLKKPPDVAARCSSVNCPVLERRSPSRRKESQENARSCELEVVARRIFGLSCKDPRQIEHHYSFVGWVQHASGPQMGE